MVYFSKKNIKCVGFDINKEKVRKINSGIIPLKDLEKWFGFNIKKMVKNGYLQATTNPNDLISESFIAHFIAVPTEKDRKPYYKPFGCKILNLHLNTIFKKKKVSNR